MCWHWYHHNIINTQPIYSLIHHSAPTTSYNFDSIPKCTDIPISPHIQAYTLQATKYIKNILGGINLGSIAAPRTVASGSIIVSYIYAPQIYCNLREEKLWGLLEITKTNLASSAVSTLTSTLLAFFHSLHSRPESTQNWSNLMLPLSKQLCWRTHIGQVSTNLFSPMVSLTSSSSIVNRSSPKKNFPLAKSR